MSFRDNLREVLEFTDMEQKELAAKTGISLKTIENYVKKDSSIPSAEKAVLIAQAPGVSVEYLISGKKSEKTYMSAIQPKYREIIEIVSKLNNYNYEVIVSISKTLLNLQPKKSDCHPSRHLTSV
jgi:transcriptional regulator with XRE-family HTH domain